MRKINKPKPGEREAKLEKELIDFDKLIDIKTKRLDILLKKQQMFLRKGYDLADFKQPVLYLIRRDKTVDFFEDVKPGNYKFEHSDTTIGQQKLTLPESQLLTFPYGPKNYKGFIHNEDEFSPYPNDIFLDSEFVRIMYEKALNDIRKWKTQELKAKSNLIWTIATSIGVVILAFAVFLILKPEEAPKVVQQGGQVIVDTVNNVTYLLKNGTLI